LASIDALGQYQDSGFKVDDASAPSATVLYTSLKVADKADKVLPGVVGDLASIDALGQYQDSGFKVDDASAPSATVLYTSLKAADKADKVLPGVVGDLASIDALGQYQDSGFKVDDASAPSATVLYSSLKLSTKVYLRASFNATAFADSTFNTIMPATISIDPESTWSGTFFVAPRNGRYIAMGVVRVVNGVANADSWYSLRILSPLGNTVVRLSEAIATVGVINDAFYVQACDTVLLNAGEQVSFAFSNKTGFTKTVDPTYSILTISEL
jgi:hypothetical protein